ncbi:hypothetical protein GW17_00015146 [Ensete ventricosum]|nr:hypothetical protein GW17_00015146 [Ensete ventricosum]
MFFSRPQSFARRFDLRGKSIFSKAAKRRGGQPRLAPMQGQPPTARLRLGPAQKGDQLQGARKGLPHAASLVVSRRGGRPLAGRLPMGKDNRRLCRGSDGDAEGERGVRASFGEKDDPAL